MKNKLYDADSDELLNEKEAIDRERKELDLKRKELNKQIAALTKRNKELTQITPYITEDPYEPYPSDLHWQNSIQEIGGYYFKKNRGDNYNIIKKLALALFKHAFNQPLPKVGDLTPRQLSIAGRFMSEVADIFNRYWEEIRGIEREELEAQLNGYEEGEGDE